MRPAWTRRLYRLHKWTGLVSAPLLLLVCLSGAAVVFKDELDAAPSGGGDTRRGFDQLIEDVRQKYRGATVSGFGLPRDAGGAYSAYLTHNRRFIEAYIDPFSGRIRGERQGDGIGQILRRVHANLFAFGWQGRVAVGFSGAVMLISAITGLLIYLPFLRGVVRQGLKWRQIRRGGTQLKTSDWHKLIGVSASMFTLVLSLTGFMLGIDRYLPRSLHRVPKAVTGSAPARLTADEAVSIARRRMPIEPTAVLLPGANTPRYTIYGDLQGSFARRAASFIVIHAATGEIMDAHDARDAPVSARWYNWMEPLHFGGFGGLALKLIYCAAGLAMSALPASGFLLWMLKRRGGRASLAP